MRAKAGILIITCLLLLVGTVAGHLPDTSTIATSNPWVIANGVDQTTITVMVSNLSLGSMQGASVMFTIDNPIYGTITPVNTTSDASGKATSTFKVNTRSGTAIITARITSHDGYIVTKNVIQSIDHDSPYYPYFTHPLFGTVASEVPFYITITDRWGNWIDDRRGPHTINLQVHGPAPDDCGFAEAGYAHTASRTLDINGNTSVMVQLTTKVGPNNILMDAFGSIPDKLEWINADTNGIPFSISQAYAPSGSPPSLPADGTSKFTIIYSLLDRYDNPTNLQWVWVNTSIAGEEQKFQTNSLGHISITYGPRSSIGVINIIATAVSNSTVTISQDVEFISTSATNMEVTANPETMASRDVNPLITSEITASVTDIMGNPVENEPVTFSLGTVRYPGGPYDVTSLPSLVSNTTTTDGDGLATVTFIPGSFSTVNSTSATGNCTITAIWGNVSKNILVTWKNYPYLSVKTSVNPQTIAVNDTVDVTIAFKGDGWAMGPKPIDAVMCTDRSGSMLYNDTDGIIDDRMVHAMNAGKIFNANMGTNDRVGLVSFGDNSATSGRAELRQGYPYQYGGAQWVGKDSTWTGDNSYITTYYIGNPRYYGTTQLASIDQNLSFIRTTVNNSINRMVPAGGTPMREGLYRSVKMLIDYPRTNAVKAVILLTDGAWNTGGNPQGGAGATSFSGVGTGSVITWAKNNNITIYTIALGSDPSQTELQAYANETGGKFFAAPTADQLATIYSAIAGELKTDAGVNTTMLTDFENVNVTGVSIAGAQVYDYVPNATASTRILWQDGVTNVTNQSADWALDNKLDFTIGTIKVGETWEATFRLKVKQSGTIDVFGANSLVSFNGGASTLTLPHTFLTVVPNLNATGMGAKTITLSNLLITEPGEINALLPVMWNMTYTGNMTVTEQIYYSIDDGPWVLFLIKTIPGYTTDAVTMEYVDYAQLDVTKLPPGGFKIKVYATAPDAPDASAITDVKLVGGKGKTFIKLE
jgi:hypothetical protein